MRSLGKARKQQLLLGSFNVCRTYPSFNLSILAVVPPCEGLSVANNNLASSGYTLALRSANSPSKEDTIDRSPNQLTAHPDHPIPFIFYVFIVRIFLCLALPHPPPLPSLPRSVPSCLTTRLTVLDIALPNSGTSRNRITGTVSLCNRSYCLQVPPSLSFSGFGFHCATDPGTTLITAPAQAYTRPDGLHSIPR